MAGTRAHTEAEKARAVGLALVNGTQAAAETSGVSRRTIQRWVDDPAMAQLVAENSEAVKGHLWAGMQVALDSVIEGLKQPEAPLQARVIAFGVLYDKHALMSGEATSRSESKNISDDLPASVKRELRRRYADLRSSGGDAVAGASEQGPASTEG